MTALPRRMYQDPCKVLQERQAEGCAGCRHMKQQLGLEPRCMSLRTPQVLADKRCDQYEDTDK